MSKRRPPVSKVRALGAKLWGWRFQLAALIGLSAGAYGTYSAHVYRQIAVEALAIASDSAEVGDVVKAAKEQCAEERSDTTGALLLYVDGKLTRVKGLCYDSSARDGLDVGR